MLNVGDLAPEFERLDHEGRTVRLSDLRGKDVLVWFYPVADTPGWTIEGSGFRDHWSEFQTKGLVILGASVDGVEANAKFAKKYSFPFPLLSDPDRTMSLAYGAVTSPDGIAKRISYLIGPDGRVRVVWPAVKPKDHPMEVLRALG